MSLKSLIKGETIDIDNHHRGVKEDIDDASIHLHKRFNKRNKRFGEAEVTVDLNRDNKHIKIDKKKGANADTIVKEIRKAFENDDLRKSFVSDLIGQLQKLALFATNHDYFTIDPTTKERTLTKMGHDKIIEMFDRVYNYFREPDEKLSSLQYIQSVGIIAQYASSTTPALYPKRSILGHDLVSADIRFPQYRSYYIKADLDNQSFSLSSSKNELLNDRQT